MTGRRQADPILLELVRYGLDAIVDEMAIVVARTARSATIRDALDYSTGLCNAAGEVIAQGVGITLHLGSFDAAIAAVRQTFEGSMRHGDIYVLNDPYESGGIHLPDIYVVKPIFRGRRPIAYAAVVAHHADIGGAVPGSNSTDTWEIYQEGLRIPCRRLESAAGPDRTLLELLRANVRVPEDVLADLAAQVAAVRAGEAGFAALLARHGEAPVARSCARLLDQTEAAARLAIAELPKGRFSFTTRIDQAGQTRRPISIRATVHVDGDEIWADFGGSSDSVRAGINCPMPFTRSAVYAAVRLVLDRDMASNGGFFRVIHVSAPEGSVVNPRAPSACGARGVTGFRVMEAVFGALAQADPKRVPADGEGGNTLISIGGTDGAGRPFVYTELVAGARGGSALGDGPEGVPHPGSNNANMPIEVAETRYPVRFEAYGLVPDTAGPGRHRGASAQVRQFRYLGPPSAIQIRSDKRRFPPYALAGGLPGTGSMSVMNPETPGARVVPTMGLIPIRTGDVFRHVMASGGGWGDPRERDPRAIAHDVQAGTLSVAEALRVYGILVDPVTLDIRPADDHRR